MEGCCDNNAYPIHANTLTHIDHRIALHHAAEGSPVSTLPCCYRSSHVPLASQTRLIDTVKKPGLKGAKGIPLHESSESQAVQTKYSSTPHSSH